MEMHPYGPVEAAMGKSPTLKIPTYPVNQIVLWVVFGLVAGSLITYLIIFSEEKSRDKNKSKLSNTRDNEHNA